MSAFDKILISILKKVRSAISPVVMKLNLKAKAALKSTFCAALRMDDEEYTL